MVQYHHHSYCKPLIFNGTFQQCAAFSQKSSILRFFYGTFLHDSLFVGKLQTFQDFMALRSNPGLLVIEGGFETNTCLTYKVFGAGSFVVSFFGVRPLDDHPSNDIRSQSRRYWQGLLRETIDLKLLDFS